MIRPVLAGAVAVTTGATLTHELLDKLQIPAPSILFGPLFHRAADALQANDHISGGDQFRQNVDRLSLVGAQQGLQRLAPGFEKSK